MYIHDQLLDMLTSHFDWEEHQQRERLRETAESMVAPSVEDLADISQQW